MLAESSAEAYGDDGGGHSEFGVHITYEDLYTTVLYFACIYVSGQIASTLLRMPSLVGEIFCGILLGPPLGTFFDAKHSLRLRELFGEQGLCSRSRRRNKSLLAYLPADPDTLTLF